jgi:hypothetical protein
VDLPPGFSKNEKVELGGLPRLSWALTETVPVHPITNPNTNLPMNVPPKKNHEEDESDSMPVTEWVLCGLSGAVSN